MIFEISIRPISGPARLADRRRGSFGAEAEGLGSGFETRGEASRIERRV